jgi:hypothetical protein
MKPLTTSIYTFSDLIAGGYLYVDKTALIHRWVSEYRAQLFLARPRRFGKSLLVSTLKAIFQGRRELFAGLAIDKMDYDWKSYPVIHLDMGSCVGKDVEAMELRLCDQLDRNAREYGLHLEKEGADRRFVELIEGLASRGEVVILVDEYDKPLLGHLGQEGVREIQSLLKSFYSVIKTTESLQRFALLTGVSKFSKVSIFSDLNNLTDLTMDREAGTLLGYTQEELESNFGGYIQGLGKEKGFSHEKTLEELKYWYNGYRFHKDSSSVYNPVSTMKCLGSREFKNYWFETGTPTFLIELLKASPLELGELNAPERMFSAYDVEKLSPLPLLVQTGYLTIQDTEWLGDELYFRLGYPNREIEQSFSHNMAQGFGEVAVDDMSRSMFRMHRALGKNDMDVMLEELKVFFANVPYDITLKNEKYYQTIFFVVFKLLGAFVTTEVRTNRGRIDAVVETKDHLFVMEFKLHDSAESALVQIRSKDYALKYERGVKPISLVGVAFDAETRNLGDWIIESAGD